MPPHESLAAFEDALLELLAQDLPPEEIARRLREDAAFADFRDDVIRFEPGMLMVAAELVKKWGRRSGVQHAM